MSVTNIRALSAFLHFVRGVYEINAWWGSCPSPCFIYTTVFPALVELSIWSLLNCLMDSDLVHFSPYLL
jgi:hypothetical protein